MQKPKPHHIGEVENKGNKETPGGVGENGKKKGKNMEKGVDKRDTV